MWITAPDCFVSIVHQPAWCAPDELVVRARARADLLAFGIADADVIATPNADYPYRANVHRDDVAAELAARAVDMAYGNMKGASERHRSGPYGRAWQAFLGLEDAQARPLPERDPWTAGHDAPSIDWDDVPDPDDPEGCTVCWQAPHAISCPVGNPSPTTAEQRREQLLADADRVQLDDQAHTARMAAASLELLDDVLADDPDWADARRRP